MPGHRASALSRTVWARTSAQTGLEYTMDVYAQFCAKTKLQAAADSGRIRVKN